MSRKPVGRRPNEKPTAPGAGPNKPGNPEPGRMSGDLPGRKEFEKPAGRPLDKPFPAPGAGGKGEDLFDGERSDRESGRPVQLESDEDEERSDRELGRPVQLEDDTSPLDQRRGRQGPT